MRTAPPLPMFYLFSLRVRAVRMEGSQASSVVAMLCVDAFFTRPALLRGCSTKLALRLAALLADAYAAKASKKPASALL